MVRYEPTGIEDLLDRIEKLDVEEESSLVFYKDFILMSKKSKPGYLWPVTVGHKTKPWGHVLVEWEREQCRSHNIGLKDYKWINIGIIHDGDLASGWMKAKSQYLWTPRLAIERVIEDEQRLLH